MKILRNVGTTAIALLFILPVFAQPKREIVTEYWDANQTKIRAQGYYRTEGFSDLGRREGEWVFFFKSGQREKVIHFERGIMHGKAFEYHDNGKLKHEGYFFREEQDSVFRSWNRDGILVEEGHFDKGKKIGFWNYQYPDGKPYMREEYRGEEMRLWEYFDAKGNKEIDKGNGTRVQKFSDGRVKEEAQFKNGLQHGTYKEFNFSGKLIAEGAYFEGKMHGPWKVWLPDGVISLESNYVKGLLEGKYTQYFNNGKVQVTGTYKEGLKEGLWQWFSRDGQKDIEGHFVANLRQGEWQQWHLNGQLHSKGNFKDDKKTGDWIFYYESGALWRQGGYINDQKEGLWTTWFESGKKLQEGGYKNDVAEGLWQSWFDNGQMKDEGSFSAGLMHGQWRGWFPNGKPSYQGSRTRDLQDGKWTFYHSTGHVSEEGAFTILKRKDALGEAYGNSRDGYEQSVKSGHWIMYSQKDHKKSGEGDYKEGKMHGKWTYYYPGGLMPAVSSTYKDGKQHGTTTEFTIRGKKKMEINYKDNLKDGDLIAFDKNERIVHHQVYKDGRVIKDEIKKTKYKYKK